MNTQDNKINEAAEKYVKRMKDMLPNIEDFDLLFHKAMFIGYVSSIEAKQYLYEQFQLNKQFVAKKRVRQAENILDIEESVKNISPEISAHVEKEMQRLSDEAQSEQTIQFSDEVLLAEIKNLFIEAQKGGGYTEETGNYFLDKFKASLQ